MFWPFVLLWYFGGSFVWAVFLFAGEWLPNSKWSTFLLSGQLQTLSGRIGKVVASHAAVARSIPLRCTDLYYARGAQGYCP